MELHTTTELATVGSVLPPATFFGLARELRDDIYSHLHAPREIAMIDGNPEQLEDMSTQPLNPKYERRHWYTVRGPIKSLHLVCRQFSIEYSESSAQQIHFTMHDNHDYDRDLCEEYWLKLPKYLFNSTALCLDYLVKNRLDRPDYSHWVPQLLEAMPSLQSATINVGVTFNNYWTREMLFDIYVSSHRGYGHSRDLVEFNVYAKQSHGALDIHTDELISRWTAKDGLEVRTINPLYRRQAALHNKKALEFIEREKAYDARQEVLKAT